MYSKNPILLLNVIEHIDKVINTSQITINEIIIETERTVLEIGDKLKRISNMAKKHTNRAQKIYYYVLGSDDRYFDLDEHNDASIKSIEDNTKSMLDLVNKMEKNAQLNLANVKQMNTIVDNIRFVREATGEIEDIADWTNILAINASVVAAKAGEYGRGFSVVAAEVGNLAVHADKASKEIVEIAEKIEDNCKEIYIEIDTNVVQDSKKVQYSKDVAQEVISTITSSMNELTLSIASLVSDSENIYHEISQVVVSLQFQDIIRQKLEKVVEKLFYCRREFEMKSVLTSPQKINKSEVGNMLVRTYTAILEVNSYLGNAIGRIEDSVDKIIRGINLIANQSDSHIGDTKKVITNFIGTQFETSFGSHHSIPQKSVLLISADSLVEIISQMEISAKLNLASIMKIKGIIQEIATVRDLAGTIKKIARQANLLALNARIEAARAGQYGVQFGVVADQTIQLSEKSIVASKRIIETTDLIDQESQLVYHQVDYELLQDRNKIESGKEMISKIKHSIVDSVNNLSNLLETMIEGAEDISTSMRKVLITLKFRDYVSRRLNKMSVDLNGICNELSEIVVEFTPHLSPAGKIMLESTEREFLNKGRNTGGHPNQHQISA